MQFPISITRLLINHEVESHYSLGPHRLRSRVCAGSDQHTAANFQIVHDKFILESSKKTRQRSLLPPLFARAVLQEAILQNEIVWKTARIKITDF